MNKIISVLLVLVLVVGSIAQNLDEIITKCLDAVGQEKLSKVESMTIKAKIFQGGMEIPLVLYQKRPMKYRSEATFQGMTMLQVYNDGKGYMINPFTGSSEPMRMNGEQLERLKDQADIDNILLTYKKWNYNLEYMGTDEMEGMKVWNLKLTKPDSEVTNIAIDPENYVVVKVVSKMIIQGVEREIEAYPSNYKYVEGILFPFAYEQKIGGQTFMNMTFESFELNTNPPDSLFVVPEFK
jgi:outer membrane lipoprotein-sorting protein